jgi:dihydroxyacetone kinase
MKKLINHPGDVVPELLEGLTRLNPGLILMPEHMIVLREDDADKVAVISGGGSGHEPAHAGYVGAGLLRAAVAGDVFASPTIDAVLAAIRAVDAPKGVLLVVKNYTGDRLNFGVAAELARAEGIPVEMVVVGDDVALASGNQTAGRRGLAGTVLIHKIAGAAAAAGADLATVVGEARDAIAALGSIGVALSSCTVPEAGSPGFVLPDDEIELGLGIHGEPGVKRLPMATANALVREMLGRIIDDMRIDDGERVVLLVNNLGATPPSELLIVARAALTVLANADITVERCWTGTFLTALDMQGVSLSLMRVNDARLGRLDAAANASAWPAHGLKPGAPHLRAPAADDTDRKLVPARNDAFEAALRAITTAVLAAEAKLTAMDQAIGDGDLGISLARGARAIEDDLARYDLADPAATLEAMAGSVRRELGGTSGPLYAVFLLRAAKALAGNELAQWSAAFEAGWRGIAELGDSKEGDRTMLDALAPASAAFRDAVAAGASAPDAVAAAARAARAGTEATRAMFPRRGRSSYLAERVGNHADPGAEAVAIWLAALSDHLAPDPAP